VTFYNCIREYNRVVTERSELLRMLGGEAGCRRLSSEFYARVGRDPALRLLFPGKSLRCATEEFAAFLIQFLGGDEEQTQKRWWLSLRESHARFRIESAERSAWLKHMAETLDANPMEEAARKALRGFFEHGAAYVTGQETAGPQGEELAARWRDQRLLDDAVSAITGGRDQQAVALASRFLSRPTVFVGLLARMIESRRRNLIAFAVDAVEHDPRLAGRYFAGRTLLHYASGAGCLEMAYSILSCGGDPGVRDSGGHTPLYRVANECASEAGPDLVRALVRAGADVNACGGVTRATPLHMAARRGYLEIARALLDSGAAIGARDHRGVTPLQRAINCGRDSVARLLSDEAGQPPGAT
jgi:truncated hemoglobin YjbI